MELITIKIDKDPNDAENIQILISPDPKSMKRKGKNARIKFKLNSKLYSFVDSATEAIGNLPNGQFTGHKHETAPTPTKRSKVIFVDDVNEDNRDHKYTVKVERLPGITGVSRKLTIDPIIENDGPRR